MPLGEKCQRADFVLNNTGDKEELKRQTFDLCIELDKITLKQKMLRPFLILFSIGVIYFCLTSLFL